MGSFFLHQAYLKSYKKEFKEYLKTNKQNTNFSTITIFPSELYTNSKRIEWEDEFKEVVYQGTLYDVVKVSGKGLVVELTVVSDHQEMKLKKQFAEEYDLNSKSPTKNPFELLKSFFSLKYLANNCDFSFDNSVLCFDKYVSFQKLQINLVVINFDTPPPQFFAL